MRKNYLTFHFILPMKPIAFVMLCPLPMKQSDRGQENCEKDPISLVSDAICDAEVAYQVFYESKYYVYNIAKFTCQLENSKCCSETLKMKKPF